ncbi:tetratricopeptide repeat protein [Pseudomonas neuropathica]
MTNIVWRFVMPFYSFRTPRYTVESPRKFKINRTFTESSLVLPDGRKVHQIKQEKLNLDLYCREHFGASADDVLEARKAELTSRLEAAVDAAKPFMHFNNGGIPVPSALVELEKTLLDVACEGSSDAKIQLGLLYCGSGQHFGHSQEEGLSWLLKAYKQNHSDAPAELGVYYLRQQDWGEAIKYLRSGDKQGCPLSRYKLAEVYMEGVPQAPQSISKAFSLFKRSSEGGYPLATVRMVALHLYHEIPTELTATPVELLREAVNDGCKEAMFLLADLHRSGDGAPNDLQEAVRLYYMAACLGYPDAQLWMGHIMNVGERKGFPVKSDLEESLLWYAAATHISGSSEVRGQAYFCLGYHSANAGRHHAAYAQFQKAAELGYPEAPKALALAKAWIDAQAQGGL